MCDIPFQWSWILWKHSFRHGNNFECLNIFSSVKCFYFFILIEQYELLESISNYSNIIHFWKNLFFYFYILYSISFESRLPYKYLARFLSWDFLFHEKYFLIRLASSKLELFISKRAQLLNGNLILSRLYGTFKNMKLFID